MSEPMSAEEWYSYPAKEYVDMEFREPLWFLIDAIKATEWILGLDGYSYDTWRRAISTTVGLVIHVWYESQQVIEMSKISPGENGCINIHSRENPNRIIAWITPGLEYVCPGFGI